MANSIVWLASQAGRLDELAQLPRELFDHVTLQRSLYVAVANNHAGIVRFLLRAGVTINNNAHLLRNALHAAARYDSADVLRTLVEGKADVNNATNRTWSAVVTAVEHGATACLQVLVLAKADLTATKDDLTPVCAAARNGDMGMLHLLLQHKASADMRKPITLAALDGQVGAVHVLLLAKANIESSSCNLDSTPLIAAANHGHVAIMLLLLQAKADAMHCWKLSGWSALSAAASAGNTAAVRCLLQHAPALATVVTREPIWRGNVKFPAGTTPLDIARRFKHADVISLLVAATSSQKTYK